jgi:hypothetical protein
MEALGKEIKFEDLHNGLEEGIDGYLCVHGDTVYLSSIEVQVPNQGRCQRYLEKLESKYKVVKVPNVISAALLHILQKRGYKPIAEWAEEFGEFVDVWVKISC